MYKGTPSTSATSDGTAGEAAAPNGDTKAPSPRRASDRLVSLIDYEYSGYNPRGFDIGNHFCEWTADYAAEESHVVYLERYPSMEERRRYCRAYLGTANGVRFCLPLPACLCTHSHASARPAADSWAVSTCVVRIGNNMALK